MNKYWIITYGCQMNKSDSERIATILEDAGYKPASKENAADLIVVNMCSVRQSAVDRVYSLAQKLEKLKEKNKKLKTILTGCILPQDKPKFAKKFDKIIKFDNLFEYAPKRKQKTIAFIPISNGCNFKCAYCAVPFTRGKIVYRGHEEILKEAKEAVLRGCKEIWLLGQIVNNYTSPHDPKINFANLLKKVAELSGNFKVFFTSPHPSFFTDELIEVMANSKKIARYLNLPVQSGDNEILRKMNRSYTVEQYKDLVKNIRQKMPDIYLSTDIIVGFPGETKNNFKNTLKLVKEIKFNNIYIGKYSPRPGTAAFKMKDNVSLNEKKRREKILRETFKTL